MSDPDERPPIQLLRNASFTRSPSRSEASSSPFSSLPRSGSLRRGPTSPLSNPDLRSTSFNNDLQRSMSLTSRITRKNTTKSVKSYKSQKSILGEDNLATFLSPSAPMIPYDINPYPDHAEPFIDANQLFITAANTVTLTRANTISRPQSPGVPSPISPELEAGEEPIILEEVKLTQPNQFR